MTTSLEILAEAGYMSWTDLHRSVKADADKITELQTALLKKDEELAATRQKNQSLSVSVDLLKHERDQLKSSKVDSDARWNQLIDITVPPVCEHWEYEGTCPACEAAWSTRQHQRNVAMRIDLEKQLQASKERVTNLESWQESIRAEVGPEPYSPFVPDLVTMVPERDGTYKKGYQPDDVHPILDHYKQRAEHIAAKLVDAKSCEVDAKRYFYMATHDCSDLYNDYCFDLDSDHVVLDATIDKCIAASDLYPERSAPSTSSEHPTDFDLLSQALGALEYHRMLTRPIDRTDVAIVAIRKRLGRDVNLSGAWTELPQPTGGSDNA